MNGKLPALAVALGILCSTALANNLAITNVTLKPIDRNTVGIEFDLAWDHSWFDEVNFDAVWLFVKYSIDEGATWSHATLKGSGTNPAGYSPGTNAMLAIVVPADRKGAFTQPTAVGRRNIQTQGMRLLWDRAEDGVPAGARGRVSVQGLEMVYIPAGPYYVGDNSSPNSFKVTYINADSMTNGTATGAGTIVSPYTNLTSAGMGRPYGVTGTFDTNYPNGYRAFYIMKHELSRARYLGFHNLLTYNQSTNLRAQQTTFAGSGNAIGGVHPNLTNVQPWRATSFLASINVPSCSGWREFAAYTDWAALRPMTEMEFEKAARGPDLPVDRGLPWGRGHLLVNHLTNGTSGLESPVYREANLVASGGYAAMIAAPVRPGAMSDASTDQAQAGASYYGVLELAGNVYEQCIASGASSAGLAPADSLKYSGVHGDGLLTPNGTANTTNWPIGTQSFGGGPIGVRGGDFSTPTLFYNGSGTCTISDRFRSGTTWYVGRGIRAVRTAP